MANVPADQQRQLQAQLQQAVMACSERCLYQSAKWAAELLNALHQSADNETDGSETDIDSTIDEDESVQKTPALPGFQTDPEEARLESRELPRYLMAKSFFDCREFDRCAAVFLPNFVPQGSLAKELPTLVKAWPPLGKGKAKVTTGSENSNTKKNSKSRLSQKALFLSLYAKYLGGEKRKDEESEMILGPADGPVTSNKELSRITRVLEEYFSAQAGLENVGASHGWLEYLYGIVLSKGKNDSMAKTWLLKSVNLYSWNWGAWLELAALIGSVEELGQVMPLLPQNLMTFIFHIYANQEFYQTSEAVFNQLDQISAVFPDSAFLQTQRALLHYHTKDFDEADNFFSTLLRTHPYRLDSMDAYSNVL
ncbi:Anaphase-promoting complex subunit 8, partial [Elasticomyces elasticus]